MLAYTLQMSFDFSGYRDMRSDWAPCSGSSCLLQQPLQSQKRHRVLVALAHDAEATALGTLADAAAWRGVGALVGEHRPSGRNGMVKDRYGRLGFEPIEAPAGFGPGARF